jgi:hypothetical protein
VTIDPAKTYDWQCNRCNAVRTQGVGYCPNCGCPEFRMMPLETVGYPPYDTRRRYPLPDQLTLPGM